MSAGDCGQCDVCIAKKSEHRDNTKKQKARQAVFQILADGKEHLLNELSLLAYDSSIMHSVIREMVDEEEIKINKEIIRKK
jgi:ATP-dependent DNA helicase RecQ